jgi:hypothetical protein
MTLPIEERTHDARLVARQIGGKTLSTDSVLWRTLFPSGTMRVEGRVPTKEAAKFLIQMRMNSTKELYAVAFSPAPQSDETELKTMNDFLLTKE